VILLTLQKGTLLQEGGLPGVRQRRIWGKARNRMSDLSLRSRVLKVGRAQEMEGEDRGLSRRGKNPGKGMIKGFSGGTVGYSGI
jgi:hypothetical protein